MKEIGDLVKRLIEAGCAPDVSAMAIAEAFARGAAACTSTGSPVDTAAEKRRAYDRERKAAQREMERTSTGSPPEVHRTSADQLSLTDSKKVKKERAIGKICPPDFQPSDHHYLAGAKLNINRAKIDELCGDMRSWSAANSNRAVARKSDWGLTLHQWIKRFDGERKRPTEQVWRSGHEGVI